MVTSLGLWPIYYERNFWHAVYCRGGPLVSLSRYAIVLDHTTYSTCRIAVQFFRLYGCFFYGAPPQTTAFTKVHLSHLDLQRAIGMCFLECYAKPALTSKLN
jgi:hypothetical protein